MGATGNISGILDKDKQDLINTIGQGPDISYRHLTIPSLDNCQALIVYVKGLANTTELEDSIIAPLTTPAPALAQDAQQNQSDKVSALMKYGLSIADVTPSKLWADICDHIVSGDSVLFMDQSDTALILANRGWKQRSISEPTTEVESRGPKDCFLEDIMSNMGLIRRRIRDYNLRFEGFKIGDRSKTDVVIAYIEDLVSESLLNEVRTRLGRIKTDGISNSSAVEEYIQDSPFSIFPQTEHTERPDRGAAALLEGRIVILVDNAPFQIIVPATFWSFIQVPGDYYARYIIGTFWRWIRLFAIFLTISSSSAYVLLTSFHQEMLPTSLALKVAAGRMGVPFPAAMEAFVMEIIFEIMTEAGLRMPKALGQTVSIIGTLVIGQGAVMAGLVGPALVIAVAIGAIASFAIPSFSMSNSIRLLRFPLLFSSAVFGLFGYLGGGILITIYLMSLRSFGTPFYAPIGPFIREDLKDTLVRVPRWQMITRPWFARPKDKPRQAPDLKPKPDPQ